MFSIEARSGFNKLWHGRQKATPAPQAPSDEHGIRRQLQDLLNEQAARKEMQLANLPAPLPQEAPPAKLGSTKAALPCPFKWCDLHGDDRVRWSHTCKHFVYNPQGLTADELAALIWFREGVKPSILYRRIDGLLMTENCTHGAITSVKNSAVLVAWMVAGFLLLMTTCMNSSPVVPARSQASPPITAGSAASVTRTIAPQTQRATTEAASISRPASSGHSSWASHAFSCFTPVQAPAAEIPVSPELAPAQPEPALAQPETDLR